MFNGMFGNRNINKVTVNGKTYTCEGNSVVVQNGKIIVDGKTINDEDVGSVNIVVNGNVEEVHCDCGSVKVLGSAITVECGGSCEIGGNVDGNVSAGGSVRCWGKGNGNIIAGGSVRIG